MKENLVISIWAKLIRTDLCSQLVSQITKLGI